MNFVLRYLPKKQLHKVFLFTGIVLLSAGLIFAQFISVGKQNTAAEAQTPKAEAKKPSFVTSELLIKVNKSAKDKIKEGNPQNTGIASLDEKFKKHGVKKIQKLAKEEKSSQKDAEIFSWYKISFSPETESIDKVTGLPINSKDKQNKVARSLLEDPSIEKVEPNYLVSIFQTAPNDPFFDSTGSWGQTYADLWGLKKINVEQAWGLVSDTRSIVVADIDTGVDRNHEDLRDNMWVNANETQGNGVDDDGNGYVDDYFGWDFINNDNDPIDDHGHGTHTAGTIAGNGNNGVGLVGVTWNSKVMALKFIGGNGYGTMDAGASALVYAANMGAKVSSNSWGCRCESSVVEDALKYAHDRGVVNIAAAGNDGADALDYTPPMSSYVITVAATQNNDQLATFSNRGERIDVAAPGVDILSTRSSQDTICAQSIVAANYCRLAGTSMATPHVAGLAALLLAKNNSLTNEEVRQLIRSYASDMGTPGKDPYFGYGLINAGSAVANSAVKPLTAFITSPKTKMTAKKGTRIDVVGSASGPNFASYTLEIGLSGPTTNWISVTTASTPVTNGLLGSVDTTSFQNGRYVLRLTASDTSGKSYQFAVYDIQISDYNVPLQSGWPQNVTTTTAVFGAAVHGDLDGNGDIELVSAYKISPAIGISDLGIAAWNHDGTRVPGFPLETEIQAANPQAALADITGDNKLEILVATSNGIYAFTATGQIVTGFPVATTENFEFAPITAKDLTGDGKAEIIAGTRNTGKLYVVSGSGANLAGWPKYLGFNYVWSIIPKSNLIITSATNGADSAGEIVAYTINGTKSWSYVLTSNAWVSSGDVNKDGTQEYVFYQDGPNGVGEMGVLSTSGTLINKWSTPNRLHLKEVPLGDVDGDGDLEIAGASMIGPNNDYTTGQVFLWNHDGTMVNGWPKTTPENVYIPSFADVDGDGKSEIITNLSTYPYAIAPHYFVENHKMYAWNNDGTDVSGWPLNIYAPNYSGVPSQNTTADYLDIDQDTDIELAIGIAETGMFVITLGKPYNAQANEWGTFRHDSMATGTHGYVSTPIATPTPTGPTPTPSRTPTPTRVPTPSPTPRDTTLPVTSITSPVNGATVTRNTTVTITASATDNIGVTKVEFWVNNKVACSDTTAPYSCAWRVPQKAGTTYSLNSKAFDAAGNINLSPTIKVTSK